MSQLLLGAVAMGFGVAGLFFLRFWKEARDRLFALFALAFLVLALNRAGLALVARHDLGRDSLYWVRFLAFTLIPVAVVDKNRSSRGSGP